MKGQKEKKREGEEREKKKVRNIDEGNEEVSGAIQWDVEERKDGKRDHLGREKDTKTR